MSKYPLPESTYLISSSSCICLRTPHLDTSSMPSSAFHSLLIETFQLALIEIPKAFFSDLHNVTILVASLICHCVNLLLPAPCVINRDGPVQGLDSSHGFIRDWITRVVGKALVTSGIIKIVCTHDWIAVVVAIVSRWWMVGWWIRIGLCGAYRTIAYMFRIHLLKGYSEIARSSCLFKEGYERSLWGFGSAMWLACEISLASTSTSMVLLTRSYWWYLPHLLCMIWEREVGR